MEYHQRTSYDRQDMSAHFLDWGNQPYPFKVYPGPKSIPLPQKVALPQKPLSTVLSKKKGGKIPAAIGLEDLSRILLAAYSPTATARQGGGNFYFRTVASAGALYPTEIYVAVRAVRGLEDGLYHFSIQHHGLIPLRTQDVSPQVAGAMVPPLGKLPVISFFLTAIIFRSAWKYRDRSYRYHLLDTGHVLEHLTLALKAFSFPYRLSHDFRDEEMNRLIGLDDTKEFTLTAVHLCSADPVPSDMEKDLSPLPHEILEASRVSQKEPDYPSIREIHRAGMSSRPLEAPPSPMVEELGLLPSLWESLGPSRPWPEVMPFPDAGFQRRSRRNYVKKPMAHAAFLAFIEAIAPENGSLLPGRFHEQQSIATGLILGEVESKPPGFYLLKPGQKQIGRMKAGPTTKDMAHICLDQAWLAQASMHVLFLVNLEILERCWGSRGYRYALLTAGRLGERLYVTATAMGIGCCGIGAFYDGEAMESLELNPHSHLLYLVALGPVKRT